MTFASLPDFNIDLSHLTFQVPILRKSFFRGQGIRGITTWEAWLLLLPNAGHSADAGSASLTLFTFSIFVNLYHSHSQWKPTRNTDGWYSVAFPTAVIGPFSKLNLYSASHLHASSLLSRSSETSIPRLAVIRCCPKTALEYCSKMAFAFPR